MSVGNNHVYTVEGNTTDSVGRRSYALNDTNIFGYGRPNWGTQSNSVENNTPTTEKPAESPQKPQEKVYTYKVELPLLRIGDKNGWVKTVQTLLIERGYNCGNKKLLGREKPDGEFGQSTERAVADFQTKCGLYRDGEVGGATWSALLKEL